MHILHDIWQIWNKETKPSCAANLFHIYLCYYCKSLHVQSQSNMTVHNNYNDADYSNLLDCHATLTGKQLSPIQRIVVPSKRQSIFISWHGITRKTWITTSDTSAGTSYRTIIILWILLSYKFNLYISQSSQLWDCEIFNVW